MHLAGTGKLASERAAEVVSCLNDCAAPAGSWQGWPGVEGVCAQELLLHAVFIASAEISQSHPW